MRRCVANSRSATERSRAARSIRSRSRRGINVPWSEANRRQCFLDKLDQASGFGLSFLFAARQRAKCTIRFHLGSYCDTASTLAFDLKLHSSGRKAKSQKVDLARYVMPVSARGNITRRLQVERLSAKGANCESLGQRPRFKAQVNFPER